ncbi:invasion associated locus B family protein [Rhodovulum sp. YNF3179]|uniref:invasion associated locus B family protein n=1 Tax=Rhodovulum sp. YNF3179 TaxID=3425127 RepID=UPI003D338364
MLKSLGLAIGGAALAFSAMSAAAQEESDNRVAAKTDWSVFVEDDPTECWVVSSPKETVNTKNGRVVAVRRGDILLFVSYRPGSGVNGEVSFTGGYPFNDSSTVSLQVGEDSFELFTDGEWAWAENPQADQRIVTALKGGAEAVVTGLSSRGTTTKDTFSLMGITAALDEAEARCSS